MQPVSSALDNLLGENDLKGVHSLYSIVAKLEDAKGRGMSEMSLGESEGALLERLGRTRADSLRSPKERASPHRRSEPPPSLIQDVIKVVHELRSAGITVPHDTKHIAYDTFVELCVRRYGFRTMDLFCGYGNVRETDVDAFAYYVADAIVHDVRRGLEDQEFMSQLYDVARKAAGMVHKTVVLGVGFVNPLAAMALSSGGVLALGVDYFKRKRTTFVTSYWNSFEPLMKQRIRESIGRSLRSLKFTKQDEHHDRFKYISKDLQKKTGKIRTCRASHPKSIAYLEAVHEYVVHGDCIFRKMGYLADLTLDETPEQLSRTLWRRYDGKYTGNGEHELNDPTLLDELESSAKALTTTSSYSQDPHADTVIVGTLCYYKPVRSRKFTFRDKRYEVECFDVKAALPALIYNVADENNKHLKHEDLYDGQVIRWVGKDEQQQLLFQNTVQAVESRTAPHE